MKPIRWTAHALASLVDREIDREEEARAIGSPDRTLAGQGGRQILLRKFDDSVLLQPMLLCVVTEDYSNELVVVMVYKTSKLDKYLKRGAS